MRNAVLELDNFREKEIWNDGYLAGSTEAGSPEMSLYRHVSTGNLYMKLYDAQIVDTKESVVIYRSVKDGRIWVRDAKIFSDRFEELNEE
jgi:hypothetical protein